MDFTRWNSARIIVIGADYSDCDRARWGEFDRNFIAIGSEGQRDWNRQEFWDEAIVNPTRRRFNDIYIDRCCLFIFAANLKLFENVLRFVQFQLSKNGRLHLFKRDWDVLLHSFMIDKFCEGLKGRLNSRSQADADAVKSLIALGKFVPKEDLEPGAEWIILYNSIKQSV